MTYADLALIAVLMLGLYFRAFAEGVIHLGSEIIKGFFKLITVVFTRGHRLLLELAVKKGWLQKTVPTDSEDAPKRERSHLSTANYKELATAGSVRGNHRSADWIYHTHNAID